MSLLLPKAKNGDIVLGVMGGTFDPIHIGHLVTAEEARQEFNLDYVVFMPAGYPPHKDLTGLTSAEHRYLMTMLAVVDNIYFTVSRLEMDNKDGGPYYTIDTVRRLKEIYEGKANIYFITGADAILDITTWKDYEELLEICSFIAASRPGYSFSRLENVLGSEYEKVLKKVHFLEIPAMSISSTSMRRRVSESKTIKYLTPETVEQYIYKNELYRDSHGE